MKYSFKFILLVSRGSFYGYTISISAYKKIMMFCIETKGKQKQFNRNNNFMLLFIYYNLLNLCTL